MARIIIRHTFADGDITEVIVQGKNPSPDAFETMCRQAFDAWSDAMAYALAVQGTTVADDDVI
jgi:hypothetical protein